jgi:A/G-specific adenine glycosylase
VFEVKKEIAKFINKKIITWYRQNGRDFLWRETRDPYKVLVAELLLHQTFARKVEPVYSLLITKYPSPYHLSGASHKELEDIIRPLGLLYRADLLIKLAETIVGTYSGIVPDKLESLITLPGVGDYTSHAVLCFAYNYPVPVVDRNVIRVYKRFFSIETPLAKLNPTKKFWGSANSIVPKRAARDFNLGLLDFAALVCKHYSPTCGTCVLSKKCGSPGSN